MYEFTINIRKRVNGKNLIYIFCVLLLIVITSYIYLKRKSGGELKSARKSFISGDYESALSKFKVLANDNNAEAKTYLGIIYFEGKGVLVDHESAARYFTKASELGNPLAMRYLAKCYLNGYGLNKNVSKSLQFEITAAAVSNNFTKVKYENHTTAGKIFIDYIKNNNLKISNETHEVHRYNSEEADYLNKSKTVLEPFLEDSSEAAYLMGLIYSNGSRIRPDMKEAVKWFTKSAKQGNVSAQTSLGIMYLLGEGVLQDFTEAAYWLDMAAGYGSKDAQFLLGNLYSAGTGLQVDYTKAAALYTSAISKNHSLAKCYLAELFYKGYGVYENRDLAKLLCQEGFKETGNVVCYDIWNLYSLGTTTSNKTNIH